MLHAWISSEMKNINCAMILMLGVCLAGCGKVTPVSQVSGKLTMNNQPLGHCLIKFTPGPGQETATQCACAETDADGHYELRFHNQTVGVMPGSYAVILDDLDMLQPIDRGNSAPEPSPSAKKVVPKSPRFGEIYLSEKQTPLHCEVKQGNQEIDFELPKTVVWRECSSNHK
jgi:hypothetical protein